MGESGTNYCFWDLWDAKSSELATGGLSREHLSAMVKSFESGSAAEDLPPTLAAIDQRLGFQLRALEQGRIATVCPFSGDSISSDVALPVASPYGRILYRYVSRGRVFYLIGDGPWFEITGIYLPDLEWVVRFQPSWFAPTAEVIDSLKAITPVSIATSPGAEIRATAGRRPRFLIFDGHHQFAHQLWNYLSGLHKLHGRPDLIRRIDEILVCSPEFYGRVEEIFPELEGLVCRFPSLEEGVQHVIERGAFVTRLGSSAIPKPLTRRIIDLAGDVCDPQLRRETAEFRAACAPILWLTIRTNNRTAENQLAAFEGILAELEAEFPRLGVVFDGISTPEIIEPSHPVSDFVAWHIRQELAVVEGLTHGSRRQARYKVLVGRPVHEYVLWAGLADLYLAHFGTLRNKIAWFADIPGLVHSNPHVIRYRKFAEHPPVLADNQCNVPRYVSPEAVSEVLRPRDVVGDDVPENHHNYVLDPGRVAQELVATLRAMGHH